MTAERDNAPAQVFAEAVAIMARLRGEGGCPWDREQSFDTIRKYTLEETYEVLDAIERRNWPDLREELGDLLLQVIFYAQMAAEAGHFTIAEVVNGLNQKLVRRHPHVFGDEAAAAAGNAASPEMVTQGIDSQQVLRNWEEIKAAEKVSQLTNHAASSLLDAVPRIMPALMEASKLGSRAAKVGFDWPSVDGLFDKLAEETAELKEAISANRGEPAHSNHDAIAEEIGDLLFTAANLARHLKIDPELALRATNAKFRRRFAAMEKQSSTSLGNLSPGELEELWAQAKQTESASKAVLTRERND
jgi:nucleoside triphosphate diphosphatase